MTDYRDHCQELEKIRLLACLLWTYEADEPHTGKWESGHYPEITWGRLSGYLTQEHCGDCTNQPAACVRCEAEDVVHKAKWLLERMEPSE